MKLRHLARAALCIADPAAKIQAVQALEPLLPPRSSAPEHTEQATSHTCAPAEASIPQNIEGIHSDSHTIQALLKDTPQQQPTRYAAVGHNYIHFSDGADDLAASQPLLHAGHPERPELVHPSRVPQRSIHTLHGRAALLHAVIHIEFNAINLALDAIWRYANMPASYYGDWLRVAVEEVYHYNLLHQHLQDMGWAYGDFAAHNGLWEMCIKTADNITARMALVPRTLEARGLDATPLIQQRLRSLDSADAPDARITADLLDIILRDEIGHVAIGNHWYHWLCQRQGLEPVAHYTWLVGHYAAPRPKPPLNESARLAAGFTQAELDYLLYAPASPAAS